VSQAAAGWIDRISLRLPGRRGPHAGPLRLAQRNVYVLPTRAGLLYALVLLTMLIASINYALSLGFLLTFLLGAVADADFDADETTIVLGPLDTMVLVTDGVHEAPDRAGRQFGLERIQEMLSRNPVPDRWCGHLAQIVEQWRGRIGDDDLLVATIRVPSATPPLPPTPPPPLSSDDGPQLPHHSLPYSKQ
jgi:hypothetical protein